MLANVSFSKMANIREHPPEGDVILNTGETQVYCNKSKSLGSGTFGVCYPGTVANTKRSLQVVVKFIKTKDDDDSIEQLQQEVEAYKILEIHPHILRYFGSSSTGPIINFILLEHGDGDLEDHLRFNKLDMHEKYNIIMGITSAIEYMTGKLVHCDLKPANVIMVNNIPKIGDFGSIHIDGKKPLLYGNMCTAEYRPPDVYCYRDNKLYPGQYSSGMMVWSCAVIIFQIMLNATYTIFHNNQQDLYKYETSVRCKIYTLLCGEGYPDDSYQLKKMKKYAASEEGLAYRERILTLLVNIPDVVSTALVCMWEFDNKNRPNISKVIKMLGSEEDWIVTLYDI
jgi:serine/threonine protein kinase